VGAVQGKQQLIRQKTADRKDTLLDPNGDGAEQRNDSVIDAAEGVPFTAS